MKILLSPAKSLDYSSDVPIKEKSMPVFSDLAQTVDAVLKKISVKELESLMKISNSLAEMNVQRNKERTFDASKFPENFRQAIYAFNGDVYSGFDAYSVDSKNIAYMQDSIRILSGLYGILKPLDLIEPYRLEMGTKLPIQESKNLYDFWKEKVTQELQKGLTKDEVVINLASDEYFKVIDTKQLKATVITPVFKDYKNDKLKVISFYAKKARGEMARFAVENQISNPEDLKDFNGGGYRYQDNNSTQTEWLFTR